MSSSFAGQVSTGSAGPTLICNGVQHPSLRPIDFSSIGVPLPEYLSNYIESNASTNPFRQRGRFGFFSVMRNLAQQAAFDFAKGLIKANFASMYQDDGSNIHLPTDYDSPFDMPALPHQEKRGRQVYHMLQHQSEVIVNKKVGQTRVDPDTKQAIYDEKCGVGSVTLKSIFAIEDQEIESQRRAQVQFDVTNPKLCQIELGSLRDMTIGQALLLELRGLPFLAQILRYTLAYDDCPDFGYGRYTRSLAGNTFLCDAESGATWLLEDQGFIERDLRQHPHEHLDGTLGAAIYGEAAAARELLAILATFTADQQAYIAQHHIQPIACAGWEQDCDDPHYTLTPILMRNMLRLNVARNESLGEGQPAVWINAFGNKSPYTSQEAKALGDPTLIYNDAGFSPTDRQEAVEVEEIDERILYVVRHGGVLYLNRCPAAVDDMVEHVLSLDCGEGYPRWKHLRTCEFGDDILKMELDDGKVRLIDVHGPPSYQGCTAPGTGRDWDKKLPGMYDRAISNHFRYRFTGILQTESETLDIGDMRSFLNEKVKGSSLVGALLGYHCRTNLHLPLIDCGRISKAWIETSANLLLPEYNPLCLSTDSKLFANRHRHNELTKIKYHEKKLVIEEIEEKPEEDRSEEEKKLLAKAEAARLRLSEAERERNAAEKELKRKAAMGDQSWRDGDDVKTRVESLREKMVERRNEEKMGRAGREEAEMKRKESALPPQPSNSSPNCSANVGVAPTAPSGKASSKKRKAPSKVDESDKHAGNSVAKKTPPTKTAKVKKLTKKQQLEMEKARAFDCIDTTKLATNDVIGVENTPIGDCICEVELNQDKVSFCLSCIEQREAIF